MSLKIVQTEPGARQPSVRTSQGVVANGFLFTAGQIAHRSGDGPGHAR